MSESKSSKNKGGKPESTAPKNFIKEIIDGDLAAGKIDKVITRFPPEPNGYLHIGHAKSICLNFGLAKEYGGICNLRFDDTNPTKEDVEYVDSIKEDIRWLGFDWGENLFFTSDYFERLYEWAVKLIEEGKAYVDSLTDAEIKEYRGDYYKKGKPSPYRDRAVEENLDLFERMRKGEFKDGEAVLRAKIDLESQNMKLRDPIMYRIRHAHHHRTGDKWCIYPIYDWAHGQSDAIEEITHSICTLEFDTHRPLYDWYVENLGVEKRPHQYEFARLNLNYTAMSKRKLIELVEGDHVDAWDDPRMPTICGFRRRGYTPKSIRTFAERIGVAKADNVVDIALLEHIVREDLNDTSPRVMGVVDPLKLVIENYPEDKEDVFEAPFHPIDPSMGKRELPFSRELWVERDDFREDPPKKWHRLAPGKEVRLRYACLVTCKEVIKNDAGEVVELRCEWDPESRGGNAPDGRKVRGTLHWVSAKHAVETEVRLYDRLFKVEEPLNVDPGVDWKDTLNPDSFTIVSNAKVEPFLKDAEPGYRCQFERIGYFCVDTKYSAPSKPVFNRTVALRDSWARIERNQPAKKQDTGKGKQPKADKSAEGPTEITIDDFAKLDLRVGEIKEASLVEGADKLLKVLVDIGEEKPRQVFAGIRSAYPEPEVLNGRKVIVVANLKPRKMRFGLSEGMILAGPDRKDSRLAVASFLEDLQPGDKVR